MRTGLAAAVILLSLPAQAQEDGEPLSAIDWLSSSVEVDSAASTPLAGEPPVSDGAAAPGVTVSPLQGVGSAARGVLPSEVTGLPPDLWARSREEALIQRILAEPVETLPALQDLLVMLMLAEADPPSDATGESLFLARVDKLLDMGALEAARSLLESGDLLDPEVFRRWFDVTLLTGTESDACNMLRAHPALAPTVTSRVFCVARNGDWNAAVLTLNTARALGDVTPEEEALLSRFLDPDFAEEGGDLPPMARPSPLIYRLREAIGDLMPTTGLPLAFSHADLRDTVAWRAQIEAAERLARRGALSENVLLGVYTARAPAASGGVWDRAGAIQRLDAAIQAGDREAVGGALGVAWDRMSEAGLEIPFARLYGEALLDLDLPGAGGDLARRIALLSPAYAHAATVRPAASARERVWQVVATGDAEDVSSADAPSAAVLAGFGNPPLTEEQAAALEEERIGEAILLAIGAFQEGLDGDYRAISQAIAILRRVGLDDTAKRAALQFLLLDDRG